MARSGDPEVEIWGTWEELLLACAVSRHGAESWDSVAMELQVRSPAAGAITALDCRRRYLDLHRRYGGVAASSPADVPWLEELRKLRVAELRREVERYDVSIVSLQLKVKMLGEERERSLAESGGGAADLKDEDEEKNGGSHGSKAGDRISAGDSGRSCKESNSTDPKEGEGKENPRSGDVGADPVTGDDEKAGGAGSYDGSSGPPPPPPVAVGESGESVVESKEEKDSSDVQSSMSLSKGRRGRRRKAVSGSSSVGEEREADVVPVESQPLASFLEIIRSHKFGSVFERRLESQESVRYRCLIRQHVDLEMVRAKLERLGAAYTRVEFLRDLLLLCNNAAVFFTKGSPESVAAIRLRSLVARETARTVRTPSRSPLSKEPTPPPRVATKLKPDLDGKSSTLLIPCRNHGSESGTKEEKREPERGVEGEEKKTKQRSVTRGLRSNKSRARVGIRIGDPLVKSSNSTPPPSEITPETTAKRDTVAVSPAKKRGGAANFLNRINRKSPPAPSNGGMTEPKKAGRGDGRKDQTARKGTGKQEKGATVKRSVGRPPKRAAPPPSKRAREEVEKAAPSKATQPPKRKRGKK